MKNNPYKLMIVLCLIILSLSLAGCHIPGMNGKQNDSGPQVSETAPAESPSDTGAISAPPVPEDTEPEEDEEQPLITNPGRSSLKPGNRYPNAPVIRPASMQMGGSRLIRNAQIVRPTASANTNTDDGILIQNDHTVTYPERQSVIQKSPENGKLQPLAYIPPTQMSSGQSIMFSPGATSAVISGYVPAGGYVRYDLYAFANQNFLVLLSSDTGTAYLSVSDVYGFDYNQYANPSRTSYNMYLPRTATYYVDIYSNGYSENFTLQVFIPARVTIPAGKTAAVMSGTVSPYSVVSYTAYMYAGQTARIDDYSGPQPTSFLRVSGLQSGIVYMDYTAYSPSWYSVVPATQDYLIEVISMDQTSNYRLTVDVR